jgi:hypothetical protein
MDYMHRTYGTQITLLTNLRRIEIRRYNIDRAYGTLILNRTGRIYLPNEPAATTTTKK